MKGDQFSERGIGKALGTKGHPKLTSDALNLQNAGDGPEPAKEGGLVTTGMVNESTALGIMRCTILAL